VLHINQIENFALRCVYISAHFPPLLQMLSTHLHVAINRSFGLQCQLILVSMMGLGR
jgi:hypothetical protein